MDTQPEGLNGPERRLGTLPGVEGLWYFIFADLMLFALLFGSFSYQRLLDTQTFEAGRLKLMPLFATLNTLILLTSSYLMVHAVRAAAVCDRVRGSVYTAAAASLGGTFVVLKIVEYTREITNGHVPTSNEFLSYYFIITGIHLLHVCGGTIFLGIIAMKLATKVESADEMKLLESGASFWHMVDLLWLIVFPLLYLLR